MSRNHLPTLAIIHPMGYVLLDSEAMRRTLGRMAHEVLDANRGAEHLVVVGVMRRGYPVAKRLAFLMTQSEGITVPCGKLDARASRDDKPEVTSDQSEIPFQITGKRVIVVDEVIFTGRTIRASLDALLRFGRPESVQLAVLIDRGHRELPIQPDYVGRVITTEKSDRIEVKVKEFDGEDSVLLISGDPSEAARP
ncbi:MAG: bifunctional pyr operon transcriptional regulator/uracil phosphoribosyltransferase PyrR [Fimbriimonadaceae bacterium]|nr:bifunctional pyr operon transcriptional regulator/uracil phosphoribosyltransferase PyrR [Fimbriimonadaceae bacterium]